MSKPSLDVMRRSPVTTSEIRRFFSNPCPVIRNLFPNPNPPGGVPAPPSRGLGAWLGKGGPIFPLRKGPQVVFGPPRAPFWFPVGRWGAPWRPAPTLLRCRRHRLAAGHSTPGRRPGPWRPSRASRRGSNDGSRVIWVGLSWGRTLGAVRTRPDEVRPRGREHQDAVRGC